MNFFSTFFALTYFFGQIFIDIPQIHAKGLPSDQPTAYEKPLTKAEKLKALREGRTTNRYYAGDRLNDPKNFDTNGKLKALTSKEKDEIVKKHGIKPENIGRYGNYVPTTDELRRGRQNLKKTGRLNKEGEFVASPTTPLQPTPQEQLQNARKRLRPTQSSKE